LKNNVTVEDLVTVLQEMHVFAFDKFW